jgi:hypothetical protein
MDNSKDNAHMSDIKEVLDVLSDLYTLVESDKI